MDYLLPPINLKGTFKLKEPMTAIISESVLYTVDSIKSITSLIDDDIDVEELLYIAQGLTSDEYKSDLMSKIPIVTLKSEGNAIFNIPANYFTYIPQITGKMFRNKALIVNLGYIPNELDLNFLISEINDYVINSTGLTSETNVEDISGDFIVGYEEYDTFEADRQSKLTINETCRYLYAKALTTIDNYKLKVQLLVENMN